jgi:hypothetical protein
VTRREPVIDVRGGKFKVRKALLIGCVAAGIAVPRLLGLALSGAVYDTIVIGGALVMITASVVNQRRLNRAEADRAAGDEEVRRL